MMKKKLKMGLAVSLFSSFLGTANAETITVKDVFLYVIKNGCIKEVNQNVKFGETNLKVERCNKGEVGYTLSMTGKLNANFNNSNTSHLYAFLSAFSNDTGKSIQEIKDQKLCEKTTMPIGANCTINYKDGAVIAQVFNGMDYLSIMYTQK